MIPDGFDMGGLFKQAQQMQQQMEELGDEEVTGTAGGGLVKATVTGLGVLTGLEIAPEAVDPADTETLADLVLAAVRDAVQAADRLQKDRLGPLHGAIGGFGGGLGGPGGF